MTDSALHVVRLTGGDPARRPLVLLHGFTGDTTTWLELVEQLPWPQPVWAIDLVGHGRSPHPAEPEAYEWAAAVAAIGRCAAEAGLARAHWLGYSLGGRLALALAPAEPDRVASLTLVGASPGLATEAERAARRAADEALARSIETEGLERFVDAWMAQPLFASQSARLDEAQRARARSQRLRNRPEALAATLRGLGTGSMPSLWDRLGEVGAPVLLVAGEEDSKFAGLARSMAEGLPRAEVAIVPEAGHAVQAEAPAALAARWEAFRAAVDGEVE